MTTATDNPLEGYEAMGHPVPVERLSAAYRAVKEMVPGISTEHAMTLVGRVAGAIERDEPYEAMRLATSAPIGRGTADVSEPAPSDFPPVQLDLTGGYRLLAHLLA